MSRNFEFGQLSTGLIYVENIHKLGTKVPNCSIMEEIPTEINNLYWSAFLINK